MAQKSYVHIESFRLGEVSEKAQGQMVQSGLKECVNMLPTRTNSLETRPGMRHLLSKTAATGRLISVADPSTGGYSAAILTNNQLEIYRQTGALVSSGNLLSNADFNTGQRSPWIGEYRRGGSATWLSVDSGRYEVPNEAAFKTAPRPNPSFLVYPYNGTMRLAAHYLADGPYAAYSGSTLQESVLLENQPDEVRATTTVYFGSPSVAGDFMALDLRMGGYAQVQVNKTNPITRASITWALVRSYRITVHTKETSGGAETLVFDSGFTESDVIDTRFLIPALSTQAVIRMYPRTADSFGGYRVGSAYVDRLEISRLTKTSQATQVLASPYPESVIQDVYVVYSSDSKKAYLLHRDYAPRVLTYDVGLDNFSLTTASSAKFPADWSGIGRYPEIGTVHAGRLWLDGGDRFSTKLWASKVFDELDFTTVASVPSDPIAVTLDSPAGVSWLKSDRNGLLIGTPDDIKKITSQGGSITSTDIRVEKHTAIGVASVDPVDVYDISVFVTKGLDAVYAANFDLIRGGLKAIKLSQLAPSGYRWSKLLWDGARELLIGLNNGSLYAGRYTPEDGVISWSRLTTGGYVFDIAEGRKQDGNNDILVLIQRAAGTVSLEDLYDEVALDAFEYFTFETPTSLITGLEHLEGSRVFAVSENENLGEYFVVGGQITLDYEVLTVYVGTPFTQKIVTLPTYIYMNQMDTTRSFTKKVSGVHALILDSHPPKIEGQRPPSRDFSDAMGVVQPTVTGKIETKVIGNYSDENTITIEQDEPFPLTLLAVIMETTQTSL